MVSKPGTEQVCDWCGAPGREVGTDRWFSLTIIVMACTRKGCGHEWWGDHSPTPKEVGDARPER